MFDEDAGRFTVLAENPHGKVSCSAILHVDLEEGDTASTASTTLSKQTVYVYLLYVTCTCMYTVV